MNLKEKIVNRLQQWKNCGMVKELNQKWINAKKYIIKKSSTIEERFELDRLIEDSYAEALNEILNRNK